MIDLLNGYGAAQTFTAQDIRPAHLGRLGEQAIIRLAYSLGYLAGKAQMYHGDVFLVRKTGQIEVTEHIEVKTAKRDKSGMFQFCLKRSVGKRVCTDCSYADTVILLAVADDFKVTMFVIPSSVIGTQKKIAMRNIGGASKYSQYIQGVL